MPETPTNESTNVASSSSSTASVVRPPVSPTSPPPSAAPRIMAVQEAFNQGLHGSQLARLVTLEVEIASDPLTPWSVRWKDRNRNVLSVMLPFSPLELPNEPQVIQNHMASVLALATLRPEDRHALRKAFVHAAEIDSDLLSFWRRTEPQPGDPPLSALRRAEQAIVDIWKSGSMNAQEGPRVSAQSVLEGIKIGEGTPTPLTLNSIQAIFNEKKASMMQGPSWGTSALQFHAPEFVRNPTLHIGACEAAGIKLMRAKDCIDTSHGMEKQFIEQQKTEKIQRVDVNSGVYSGPLFDLGRGMFAQRLAVDSYVVHLGENLEKLPDCKNNRWTKDSYSLAYKGQSGKAEVRLLGQELRQAAPAEKSFPQQFKGTFKSFSTHVREFGRGSGR